MATKLELEFHDAMIDVYRRAKAEAGYNATRFLTMVVDRGGVGAARYLLHSSHLADGYAALCALNKHDLTMEALVLQQRWRPLFTIQELRIAHDRLKALQYPGPLPDLEQDA